MIYLPLLLIAFTAVISSLVILFMNACELTKKDVSVNFALSLLFWSVLLGFPAYIFISDTRVAAACYYVCTVDIAYGLGIYSIISGSIGAALLLGKFLCGICGVSKNSL